MRAVNLVPAESRTGGLTPGKSGGMVYAVLGGLGVVLLVASVTAVSKGERAKADQELAQIQQTAQQYSAAASEFANYQSAAEKAASRIETVSNLAKARFDWAGTLREVSRVVPETAQLSDIDASVKPGIGGGGNSSQLRGALAVPAITMNGCSVDQATVADLVSRLQAMRRVTNVSLERSESKRPNKDEQGETSDASSETAGGGGKYTAPCKYFEFSLVVFFDPGDAKASTEVAPAGSETVATEAAGGTTPPQTTGGN